MLNGMCFDVARLGDKCGIGKSLEKGIIFFQVLFILPALPRLADSSKP